jgi:hypothetical protein
MDGRLSCAWVSAGGAREFLRCPGRLEWPPPPPGRLPRHAVLLADPEGRLRPDDVREFAAASLASGCCWFEIWGPTAPALERAVDAVRDTPAAGSPLREATDEEDDHLVMTASSTPDDAALPDAVRMVLCAACSTEGHGDDRTSRLFVVASGDDPFAEGLLAWLREPESIP